MIGMLALDPSVRSAGVSLWSDGELVACARVRGDLPTSAEIGARCLDVGVRAARWGVIEAARAGIGALELVFEWPQIYNASKSKGDPNDLPGLAGVGMATAATLPGLRRIRTPTPADWIGQCPKVCPRCRGKSSSKCKACRGSAWETPRGNRIRERLSPRELALVPDQHDVIDGVGLGLWGSGRLVLFGVFPGAV